MARGYEGQFGHMLNAPYVWIPLCAIFLLGLLDWRRPWRIAHLDLLVLLAVRRLARLLQPRRDRGLGAARLPGARSTCWRACSVARLPRRRHRPAPALRPSTWLAIAARLPDRLPGRRSTRRLGRDRRRLRGGDRAPTGSPTASRSTARASSPTTTASATPTGRSTTTPTCRSSWRCPGAASWDDLPAAHAAAIFFDLAAFAGLFLLGLRLRPRRAGPRARGDRSPSPGPPTRTPPSRCSRTPTTRWSPRCSSGRWCSFARPLARGALLALAAVAKFAPLALAPLYVAGDRGLLERRRERSGSAVSARSAAPRPRLRRGLRGGRRAHARPSGDRPGPGDVLGPHGRLPARPRRRRSASGARRTGSTGCRRRRSLWPSGSRSLSRSCRGGAVDRPGRGARRGGADRAPAHRRPLVLPLHPLVLPACC